MRTNWVAIVAIAVVALALTLAFIAPYGATNQATYLLDPLHRAFPELFHRDWFVTDTPPYLPVFGVLARWLYAFDPEGPVAVLAAHIAVNVATFAAIAWLVHAVGGRLRAVVIVAAFATVTMDLSMSGSYLLAGYLQPSSLATLGWVVAMAALATDRFLTCGIAAAFAGALHANYLVLGVGLFALAALARRDLTWREHAKIHGPQLAVLAVFLPSLLGAAGANAEAVQILTVFHAPVHYSPGRMIPWIKDLVAWELGGAAALYLLEYTKPARVLFRFSLAAAGVVIASAIVIRWTPLTSLTQVRWSRIGPFAQLACQALIAAALCVHASEPRAMTPRARVLVALGLLAPLALTALQVPKLFGWIPAGVSAVLVILVLVPRALVARIALSMLAAAALAYALWASPRFVGLTTRPAVYDDDELEVTAWLRAHTPVDALLLAPPDEARFRLLARRAVVIDTKSPPLRPDLLIAWYHRLCAATLYADAPTFAATERRYNELSAADLRWIAHVFDADFIVTSTPIAFPDPPLYAHGRFAVYPAVVTAR